MSKDHYMALFERIETELLDSGMDPDAAYSLASERAYAELPDYMADLADREDR